MSHWPRQLRRALALSAALFSLFLVQNAFGIPFRHASANLNPRTLYHNLDSLAGVVLAGSNHVVSSLQTLYELRQLALEPSQPETSSVTFFPETPSSPIVRSVLCRLPIVPAPRRTDYRCPLSRRG